MTDTAVTGGPATWPEARTLLADATCLWQDLDGVHQEEVPFAAPYTSILWAWWGAPARAARVRLDGDTTYVAVIDWPADARGTIGWGNDPRILGFRPKTAGSIVTQNFDIVVRPSPAGAGRYASLTFIRPTGAR